MKLYKYALALSIGLFLAVPMFAQDEIVLKGEELFGDLKARHIGPALMSGRIIDLENHPTNSRVIYAGTAGGGVWKSSNGGATFQPIFDKYAQSIGVVAVDPTDPDKNIWVGTGEIWTRNSVSVGDGLYHTTDGGVNWNKVGFDQSERISSIEINPTNNQIIYVGVLGALWSDSNERGIFKTADGGKTWEKILFIDSKTGCSDVVMDPNDPNILYASMWEFRRTAWSFNSGGSNSALYKSTDSGKTWNKIHTGFPSGKLGRIAIAVAPSNSSRLYAVLETEKDEDKGLYRSDDGGKSWKHLNGDFGLTVRPFYFSRISIDPQNPDVVVKAGLTGSISRDGGNTFRSLGLMHGDIHDITFDRKDSDRMYVATDGGLYRSWDGGATMEIVENLPLSQFYHISVDNEEPYNVYGGLQDNGSWYGPSSSPGGVEARDWHSVGAGDGFRVLRHSEKKILYSEMQGAENIWRYDIEKNKTKSVQPLQAAGDPKLRFNWNTPIALSPHHPDRLYVGSQFLHVSDDMGDNWRKISPDLTTNNPAKQDQSSSGGLSVDNSGAENHTTIFTIAESPKNDQIIWVGTDDGNVQVTKDGGKTWKNTISAVPGLPANTWCYHIEASVFNEGTAYAVFEGHTTGDQKPYVYKTTDFGVTWKSIVTDEIYGFARNIQEDYVNPDLLYLGTEFGLYISIDGGKHWNAFTNNMPPVSVHYIELQPRTNDLVMGTHGRGVIIIDDISPLRQITSEVLAEEVHFFTPKPATIRETGGFGGTSGETQFVGSNPDNNAKIVYYLKKRPVFGRMTLEIQDESGNIVTEISPGKSKGINVVTWDYFTKQPKVAKGKTLAFGGFTSPRATAGTYKVVMNKGKESYSTALQLQNDPKSVLTDADRVKLHQTTMALFDMSEELAYLVYEMDEYITRAEHLKGTDKKGIKVANDALESLNTLKKTLVITTGDNYVGGADPELREKILNLYSKIASGYDVPSTSEMDNFKMLVSSLDQAKLKMDNIRNKEVKKLMDYIDKKSLDPIKIQPKSDFLKTSN